LEGLTEEQLDAGDDYLSVMRRNLDKLQGALGCAGS
jgi:ABC-type Zn uptake system ZnuABC Zn-binding protein ZnuA